MGEPPRSGHDPLHPPHADRAHELSDVSIRPLAVFLAGLAISLVVVGALTAWLFQMLEVGAERRDLPPVPLAEENPRTPGPLLQVSPRQDLELMREREEHLLSSTEWVNQPLGEVRIPIERAIKLTAERGFPDWPAAEVTPSADSNPQQDRAPAEPAAHSPEGSGRTTPTQGERER